MVELVHIGTSVFLLLLVHSFLVGRQDDSQPHYLLVVFGSFCALVLYIFFLERLKLLFYYYDFFLDPLVFVTPLQANGTFLLTFLRLVVGEIRFLRLCSIDRLIEILAQCLLRFNLLL